jgi:phosphate transport system substrate-binding protein
LTFPPGYCNFIDKHVAGHPHAVGYISFGYINNDIKALSVDGIAANITRGKKREYPILRPLYLYVREDVSLYYTMGFIIYFLGQ